MIRSSEQGSRYGSSTELAISYFFDPGGHPATTDKGIVLFGLKIRSVFNGLIVQPDVRDVKACESPTQSIPRGGFPGDTQKNGLIVEFFLSGSYFFSFFLWGSRLARIEPLLPLISTSMSFQNSPFRLQ